MFELLLPFTIMFLLFVAYQQLHPLYKKYRGYKKEREELTKKYNRLWKARKDLLVSITNSNHIVLDAL